jgi:hypothetical protein
MQLLSLFAPPISFLENIDKRFPADHRSASGMDHSLYSGHHDERHHELEAIESK